MICKKCKKDTRLCTCKAETMPDIDTTMNNLMATLAQAQVESVPSAPSYSGGGGESGGGGSSDSYSSCDSSSSSSDSGSCDSGSM